MALFKKVSAATLALLMTASAVSASAAGQEKILLSSVIGDGDNNGVVSANDYTKLADYIVNKGTNNEIYNANADYDFDGDVDAADLTFLRKVLLDKRINGVLAEPGKEYDTMRSIYLEAKKSKATSNFNTELWVNDVKTKTNETASELTATNGVTLMTSKSGNAEQTLWLEKENGKLSAYKQVGSSNWDKYTVEIDAIGDEVVKVVRANQFTEAAELPSYDIIELLLTKNISESAFEGCYSYVAEDGTKCILLPAANIITGADDIAGSFIIKMTKDNAPISIEIKIGTATKGDTYIVENGKVTFDTSDDIKDIAVPDELKGNIPATTTTAVTTVDPATTTPVTTADPATTTPVTTADPATTTTVTTADPATTTTTTAEDDEPTFEKYEESLLGILKKSAQYIQKAENVEIKIDTEETVVNNDATYSNKTKATAYRDGKNAKVIVDNGVITYNDGQSEPDTFVYDGAEAYGFYNGNATADIYGKANLVNGVNKLETGWLKFSASKNFGDLKSEAISSGRSLYTQVLDQLQADVLEQLNIVGDVNELNKLKTKASELETKLNNAKEDITARADKAASDLKAEAQKASEDLQAEADAAIEELKKKAENGEATEADVTALENTYKKKAEDLEAEYTAKGESLKKQFEDEAAPYEKEYNDFLDELDYTFGTHDLDKISAMGDELKAKQKAYEEFQANARKQAQEQMNVKFPTMSYIKETLGIEKVGSVTADNIMSILSTGKLGERINNKENVIVEKSATSNEVRIRIESGLFATDGQYLKDTDTTIIYTVEQIGEGKDAEYKPKSLVIKPNSTANATKKDNGANDIQATVTKGVIDFEFPTEEKDIVKVELPADAKDAMEVLDYVNAGGRNTENGNLVRFMSKYISNKVEGVK